MANSHRSRVLIACLVALLVSACSTTPSNVPSAEVEQRARLEPAGSLNAAVTQATISETICIPGWTATVRPSTSYTNGVKLRLLREQGLAPAAASTYELDHFIPLALGGHPRDIGNLWLQLWDGEWGAKTKDRLEVRLKNLVCAGRLTLESAQEAIRVNWRAAYRRYVGSPRSSADAEDGDD